MKHFISFQKRKGLFVLGADMVHDNSALCHQFNHELMKYGYFLSRDLSQALSQHSADDIQVIYNDVLQGIRNVVGDGGYEPIYKNFPQSVLERSYTEHVMGAILYYWSNGSWMPEATEYINREFKIEPVKYKEIGLITKSSYDSIFTDLIYAPTSISKFDKDIVDFFINAGHSFEYSKITFKETAAYVGKRLMDSQSLVILPTKDATNILRIWSAYSNGDEGLKTNTKFRNPKHGQRVLLLNTLNECYNLEESFKIYREKWLRLLFFLNPMASIQSVKFPVVSKYANLLRNSPKELKTFNSRVESGLAMKDPEVLNLLAKRKGVFMRRLDHTVRIFGIQAVEAWLRTGPDFAQIVTAYNHFTDRDKEQAGRGAVLAGAGQSEVVTYDAQAPLDSILVREIKFQLTAASIEAAMGGELSGKRIWIDRALYYRPMAVNNRASSMSLGGKVNGTVEVVGAGKTIRMYVHWSGQDDIDLSGFIIDTNNNVIKVGWNSQYNLSDSVVYSGDNTGRQGGKNAEYLDVSVDKLPTSSEWVVVEARIYRGPASYSEFTSPVRAGWMLRDKPEANIHWMPDTIDQSIILASTSKTAYLLALHVPTRSLVYLDLAMGDNHVSSSEDGLKMKVYLNNFITADDGSDEINWDKINQGHILNLLSEVVVEEQSQADIVFDENTTWESIAKYL